MNKLIIALVAAVLTACGGGTEEQLIGGLPAPVACFEDPTPLSNKVRAMLFDCSKGVQFWNTSTGKNIQDRVVYSYKFWDENGYWIGTVSGGMVPTAVPIGTFVEITYCIVRYEVNFDVRTNEYTELGRVCDIRSFPIGA